MKIFERVFAIFAAALFCGCGCGKKSENNPAGNAAANYPLPDPPLVADCIAKADAPATSDAATEMAAMKPALRITIDVSSGRGFLPLRWCTKESHVLNGRPLHVIGKMATASRSDCLPATLS